MINPYWVCPCFKPCHAKIESLWLKMLIIIKNEFMQIHLFAGISYNTDEQSLSDAFSKYGQVLDGELSDYLFSFSLLGGIQLRGCLN